MLDVQNRLSFLDDPAVRRMTSADLAGPDFGALRRRPTAVYWRLAEQDLATLRPLSALFWTLLLTQLVATEGLPVTLLLDEFGNLGRLPRFETTIAVARGRGVGVVLVAQSLGQLEAVYGRGHARTIRDCCATVATLGGGLDLETARWFAALTGDATVVIETESRRASGRGWWGGAGGEPQPAARAPDAADARRGAPAAAGGAAGDRGRPAAAAAARLPARRAGQPRPGDPARAGAGADVRYRISRSGRRSAAAAAADPVGRRPAGEETDRMAPLSTGLVAPPGVLSVAATPWRQDTLRCAPLCGLDATGTPAAPPDADGGAPAAPASRAGGGPARARQAEVEGTRDGQGEGALTTSRRGRARPARPITTESPSADRSRPARAAAPEQPNRPGRRAP